MHFDHIILEPEHINLLETVVEASRNVTREERGKFLVLKGGGNSQLTHAGLPRGHEKIYMGDVEALEREGLIALSYGSQSTPLFDVTPRGYRYYEHLKQQQGEPIDRIEKEVRSYLDAEPFRKQYPEAYSKWVQAESLLWGSDSSEQFTSVGHLCREAMQFFAATLVQKYQPPNIDSNFAKTINRVGAVLKQRSSKLGGTEEPFLKSLCSYWKHLNKIVQRQEHGAQKEGDPLRWEDGRRVVFQTLIVMYEIDRSLSRER